MYSELNTFPCINLILLLMYVFSQTVTIRILPVRLFLYSAYYYVMTGSISTLMDL